MHSPRKTLKKRNLRFQVNGQETREPVLRVLAMLKKAELEASLVGGVADHNENPFLT